MKTFFFTTLAMTVTVCGLAQSPGKVENPQPQVEGSLRTLAEKYSAQTVKLLLSRMRAELPKGWRASYEREYSVLSVSRDKTVLATRMVINGPPEPQKPELIKFTFAFRVISVVSPAEYRRWNAENGRIQKELSALYEELVKRRLTQKFDSFMGKTEEEKAAVARYEALKSSRHHLPEFYFGDISLSWLYGQLGDRGWSQMLYIEEERIREECTQIQKKILALLSQYEGA